ncbi:MAG: hypothetical protein WBB43_28070 [Limnoraphis sp.]
MSIKLTVESLAAPKMATDGSFTGGLRNYFSQTRYLNALIDLLLRNQLIRFFRQQYLRGTCDRSLDTGRLIEIVSNLGLKKNWQNFQQRSH